MQDSSAEVTRLLLAWRAGEQDAFDALVTLVYDELRELAQRVLKREQQEHYRGKPHTLVPTELLNEAYLRLVKQQPVDWQNRGHFFAVAALVMRRVLTDHARARYRGKRGRGFTLLSLDHEAAQIEIATDRAEELIALDDALTALAKNDPRKVQIVELRFFGGLTVEEVAEYLQTTPDAIRSQWRFAKVWLFREITQGDAAPAPSPGESAHASEPSPHTDT
jgi:RNA polymerase sigma-70 factor, ECF subfamily